MLAQHYVDVIRRAVEDGNDELLTSVGQRLLEAEAAMGILRQKGYGQSGMSLLDTARKVPAARFWQE